jgi:Ca2+-binding EF-hand superfamily protein
MIPVVVAAELPADMLAQMDQDQNQQISRQEYMQYGEQQFKQAQEEAGGQLTTAAQTSQTQTGQAQQAQTPEWQQVVRWREAHVDRNGDGIISSNEAAHAWIEIFHQLDQNGNDQLSQDELKQMQAQKALIDWRFARLDVNGDGQISLDEYASTGHDLMQFADLNRTAR